MEPEPADEPMVPRYGERSLAEVLPSVLAGMGVAGFANALDVPESRGVCVLLIDGLGWELLHRYPDDAPFLAGLAEGQEPLTAGFPSTTATSIASLGTGVPPGEHGIVGYTFAPAPHDRLLNALTWREHGVPNPADLAEAFVPEQIQSLPTALQAAADAGVRVTVAAPGIQRGSGLTRAVLRGGHFTSAHSAGDLAARVVAALDSDERALCYAYYGDLDLTGHARGPGSLAWRIQLGLIDHLVRAVAEHLPDGCRLAVVADHGMVSVGEDDRTDYDHLPELQDGVRLLGGEVRARHVYTRPGAQTDVLAAWRQLLGEGAWVLARDEAVAAGWFGTTGSDAGISDRVGDVVVAARGTHGVIRSAAEPLESRLVGHHGSLTPAEQLVPFLLTGGRLDLLGGPDPKAHQAR
ncbi:MAG: alkaline phosphatase family protein [Actinomycetota bacterium]|nr:alkaline phosphatase family protein [Actinomycetota bacterium]